MKLETFHAAVAEIVEAVGDHFELTAYLSSGATFSGLLGYTEGDKDVVGIILVSKKRTVVLDVAAIVALSGEACGS